jgi:hypothetical protein
MGVVVKKIKMGSFDAVDMRLYRGDNPYKEVGRTYSSASEAFKDADYATAIWRCETEAEHGWRVIKGWAGVISGIGLAYFFAFAFVDWLKRG